MSNYFWLRFLRPCYYILLSCLLLPRKRLRYVENDSSSGRFKYFQTLFDLAMPSFSSFLGSMKKIEEEAAEAQTQYEAITSTWDPMLEIKDPLDIDAAIKEQKRRCDALLDQKNQLIDELKGDLKRMDQAYYDDLDKQVCIT